MSNQLFSTPASIQCFSFLIEPWLAFDDVTTSAAFSEMRPGEVYYKQKEDTVKLFYMLSTSIKWNVCMIVCLFVCLSCIAGRTARPIAAKHGGKVDIRLE